MSQKLTQALVESLEQTEKIVWDSVVRGFGVRVGKNKKTYIFEGVVRGKRSKNKFTIGVHGVFDENGNPWNVRRARDAARVIQGKMASGIDPKAPTTESLPTLRHALDLHLANMEKKNRRPRSIKSIKKDMNKHMAEWLDRPIVELTSLELGKVQDRIIANAVPKADAVNPPGQAAARRVISGVGTIWKSLNKQLQGQLGGWNPADGVESHTLKPRETRLGVPPCLSFAEWYSRVLTISAIRRDLQLITLFTSVRADGIRQIRWDDIDWEKGILQVRVAKGDKPYESPLIDKHLEILEQRKSENAVLFSIHGGDHGWVFPSLDLNQRNVIPVAEPKEYRKGVKYLPGLHTLRRTYNSVAAEIGIDEFTRKTLMNHTIEGVTGKHYTVLKDLSRFRTAQQRIVDALQAKLLSTK